MLNYTSQELEHIFEIAINTDFFDDEERSIKGLPRNVIYETGDPELRKHIEGAIETTKNKITEYEDDLKKLEKEYNKMKREFGALEIPSEEDKKKMDDSESDFFGTKHKKPTLMIYNFVVEACRTKKEDKLKLKILVDRKESSYDEFTVADFTKLTAIRKTLNLPIDLETKQPSAP